MLAQTPGNQRIKIQEFWASTLDPKPRFLIFGPPTLEAVAIHPAPWTQRIRIQQYGACFFFGFWARINRTRPRTTRVCRIIVFVLLLGFVCPLSYKTFGAQVVALSRPQK